MFVLIAWKKENGRKVTVAVNKNCLEKDAFKKELSEKGIKFDGVDKIIPVNFYWE